MNNNEHKKSGEALTDEALDAVAGGQGTRWAAPITLLHSNSKESRIWGSSRYAD